MFIQNTLHGWGGVRDAEDPVNEGLCFIIITRKMKVEYINCENCNKLIQKRNQRTLCIACTNARSKEIAKIYRETHYDEIIAKNRERSRLKREAIKREQ